MNDYRTRTGFDGFDGWLRCQQEGTCHFLRFRREDPAIALDDGATKVILNTKGSAGEISDDLKSLLRYMEGFKPDSDYTRMLNEAVEYVRSDDKWRREYMVLNEMLKENRRMGAYMGKVAQVRNSRNSVDKGTLSLILMIHPHTLQEILDTMDAHPDWDDEKIAETVDFE